MRYSIAPIFLVAVACLIAACRFGSIDTEPPTVWGPDSAPVLSEGLVDRPPSRLSGPSLEYPRELREAGCSGSVVLGFVLSEEGRPDRESIRVIRSTNHRFTQAAVNQLVRSTYQPAFKDGVPVQVWVQAEINFSMAGASTRRSFANGAVCSG